MLMLLMGYRALFAGSLVYALVVLRGEQPVPEEDEAAPLLADSESD